MIKVRSLEPYPIRRENFGVLVSREEQSLVFDEEVCNVTICFDVADLQQITAELLVLIDPPIEVVDEVSQSWAGDLEIWGNRTNLGPLLSLLDSNVGLSVSGCIISEHWLRLKMANQEPTDRSVSDFHAGLSVNYVTSLPTAESELPHVTQPGVKAVLISSILPYVKPLKRFLPAQVVVALYKLLDKIR